MAGTKNLTAFWYRLTNTPFWDLKIYQAGRRVERAVFPLDKARKHYISRKLKSAFYLPTDERHIFQAGIAFEVAYNWENCLPLEMIPAEVLRDKDLYQRDDLDPLGNLRIVDYVRYREQAMSPEAHLATLEDKTINDITAPEPDFWETWKWVIILVLVAVTAWIIWGN